MSINLLPPELKPKGSLLKVSKSLKKLEIVLAIILIMVLIGLIGSYFLLGKNASMSVGRQEELKKQIKTLEETEKKLVLIQDRLQKIKKISETEKVDNQLEFIKEVQANTLTASQIKEVEIKTANSEILINASTSLDITQFLDTVINELDLKTIVLNDFKYLPVKGYEVKLSVVN